MFLKSTLSATPSRLAALISASLLAGCAAPYAPYTGADASKLRLLLSHGTHFSSAGSTIRPVDGGKCGDVIRIPSLYPYFGWTRESSVSGPVLQPRADMVGSPDPQRSDTVELRLAPGQYALTFIAQIGRHECFVGGGLDLLPGQQYQVDFRFDMPARRCVISWEQLDNAAGTWRKQPFLKGELCQGNK